MRVGIIGIKPCEDDGVWSFSHIKDRIHDVIQENQLEPTSYASIGIGLSRMVDIYAKISRKPFEEYKPHFKGTIPQGISIARRNYEFCSHIDFLIVFGSLNHILQSIMTISENKHIPFRHYSHIVPVKPCNSIHRHLDDAPTWF